MISTYTLSFWTPDSPLSLMLLLVAIFVIGFVGALTYGVVKGFIAGFLRLGSEIDKPSSLKLRLQRFNGLIGGMAITLFSSWLASQTEYTWLAYLYITMGMLYNMLTIPYSIQIKSSN